MEKINKDRQIILDGYFIDFDHKGQFRIFGPNNHLYLGLPQSVAKHIAIVDQRIIKTGQI
ncbi:hypothetical protein HY469_03235, partial [Candidatus Roizmanbacteria bacterium]|nr:hypothetical protein [Candidatus Roizmanbacteria bacterium]